LRHLIKSEKLLLYTNVVKFLLFGRFLVLSLVSATVSYLLVYIAVIAPLRSLHNATMTTMIAIYTLLTD